MIHLLKQAHGYVRDNPPKAVVGAVLSHDAHPLLQFMKYGLCGVLATVLHATVVYALGLTVIPAIGEDLPVELKKTNGMINNTIAFFVGGTVVYLLNRRFVFKPGRHHAALEAFLFFAVAGIAFVAGIVVFPLIFRLLPDTAYVEHVANLAFVITSALVNFVARKFLIFQG